MILEVSSALLHWLKIPQNVEVKLCEYTPKIKSERSLIKVGGERSLIKVGGRCYNSFIQAGKLRHGLPLVGEGSSGV